MSDDYPSALGPRKVGKKATVRVSYVVEREVEVEMPPDGDPGDQAEEKLFLRDELPDGEYERVHDEVLESEPLWEDEYDSEDDWPSHV